MLEQQQEGPSTGDVTAQQQQQRTQPQPPVRHVKLPRELKFKPILPPEIEGALDPPKETARVSLDEAAAKAVEAWIDPALAAAAAAAAAESEGVSGEEGISTKDPLSVETLGRCLPSLLRSVSFVLLHLLRGPEGRRRLKLSVAAAAEEALAEGAAAAAPSHVVYNHYAFDFYRELSFCLGGPSQIPQGAPSPSCSPLPLPAVAGVSFPLLVSSKGGPSAGRGALLDDVRVAEGEVTFYGRGLRFRILECIRTFVPEASGKDGYMSLVEAVTRAEVPIHLKAVCLPGLLAAAAKIKRKRDRFTTQLCSIVMNKTLPVRTPQHATESLARLLPAPAKKVLRLSSKHQQKQQQPQTEQQGQLVTGSFPVFVVGCEVPLPLRLALLAHATLGLTMGLEREADRPAEKKTDKPTAQGTVHPTVEATDRAAAAVTADKKGTEAEQQAAGETAQATETEAEKKAEAERDKQIEKGTEKESPIETGNTAESQAADEPVVALHAIQSVLFKALELSVPLLPDPFMGPSTRASSARAPPQQQQQQQQQDSQEQHSKVRVLERESWPATCKSLFSRAASSRASLSCAVARVLKAPQGGPLSTRGLSLPDSHRLQQEHQQLPQQPQQQQQWTAEELFLWCAVDSLVRQAGLLLCRGEETLAYALQRLNICAAPQPQQGDMEVGPLASACLVYALLILFLGGLSLPSPLCLSQRAVWALKAACIFMQHADADAAAAAAAMTVRQHQQQQQQQKNYLSAAAAAAGIWKEARWLLQRKAEQLFVFGVSLLPTVKLQQPQRFETTHSLRAHPALLLLLLLQQMAAGSTSAARGLLLLTQGGSPPAPGQEASLSSLGLIDTQGVNGHDSPEDPSQPPTVKGGDLTVLYRCIALLTGLFEWKEQISLLQNLLTPKESQLADSACAAILILAKDRWCEKVLEQAAASSEAKTAATAIAKKAAATEEPTLKELNLRMLTFVVQTQLIKRQEPIAEGSERLSCVLNWLKLVLIPGKTGSSADLPSSPFFAMGTLLLQTHRRPLLTALGRLASQVDTEEMLMRGPEGEGGQGGPQCLLPCVAPSTADKIDVVRPCSGVLTCNAAVEQRTRLHLVCLVLREVRDLIHQAPPAPEEQTDTQ